MYLISDVNWWDVNVGLCNFDRLFLFDSYLLNLSSNFTKMATIECQKPGIYDCERIISVDYIMNAPEPSKVRLPFFETPCIDIQ